MEDGKEKSIFLKQENGQSIVLTWEQEKDFSKQLKNGICRELHAGSLLTDEQLGELLNELDS